MKTSVFAVLMIAIMCAVQPSLSEGDTPATPALGSNHPTPTSSWNVGSLRVEKFGSGQPAVILVPGLGCGTWVWDSTIRELSPKHTVYAITLAGFDGTPAVQKPVIDKADASLQTLIDSEHLDKPILIGHSLGGFLTLRFAEEHSAELGGAVSVDGTPVFPTMAQMTSEQRETAAMQFGEPLRAQTHDQFVSTEKAVLSTMITDSAVADQAANLTARSDTGATADYVEEMLRADLRPALSQISTRLLVVVPIPKDLPPGYPDSMRSMSLDQLSATFVGFYTSLFAGARTVELQPIPNARHFAMLDQPAAFNALVESFVAGNGTPEGRATPAAKPARQ